MRSQVSSLQQNGLKFGIANMRGNWNSFMGGCELFVMSSVLLTRRLERKPAGDDPSRRSCRRWRAFHHDVPIAVESAMLQLDTRDVASLRVGDHPDCSVKAKSPMVSIHRPAAARRC